MGKSLKGKELGIGISQRKDGLYQGNFTDAFGKRQFVYGKTLKEVRDKLDKKRHENTIESSISPSDYTINEWFDYWINHFKSNCRNTTRANYNLIYSLHIKDVIGDRKLNQITSIQVQSMIDKIDSPSMRKYSRTILNSMFEWAVKNKLLKENIIDGVFISNVNSHQMNKRFLLDYEIELVKKYLKKSRYYLVFMIGLHTGMRCGEILALKWKHIDFENNIIHVENTYVTKYLKKYNIRILEDHEPKTKRGYRNIPITSELRELLLKYKSNSKSKDENVALTKSNTPFALSNINKCYYNLVKKINKSENIEMESFSSHAIRRTFATNAIKNGMNPKALQYILGHSSFQMTMDLYCQVSNDMIIEEMKCMDVN